MGSSKLSIVHASYRFNFNFSHLQESNTKTLALTLSLFGAIVYNHSILSHSSHFEVPARNLFSHMSDITIRRLSHNHFAVDIGILPSNLIHSTLLGFILLFDPLDWAPTSIYLLCLQLSPFLFFLTSISPRSSTSCSSGGTRLIISSFISSCFRFAC